MTGFLFGYTPSELSDMPDETLAYLWRRYGRFMSYRAALYVSAEIEARARFSGRLQ
jgi:hypothetical protein